MIVARDDLRRLRGSILLMLVLVGLGVGSIVASRIWLKEQHQALTTAQSAARDARSRLVQAQSEELEIRQKIARFETLAARGVIGPERRLDWADRMREIRDTRRLYGIAYEISPQQPVDPVAAPGSSAPYDFRVSRMRVELPLLHEEDLLHLLADLRRTAPAFVRPRSCMLERLPRVEAGAQLRSDCTLEWITIGMPERPRAP